MKNPIDFFENEKGDITITINEQPVAITYSSVAAMKIKDSFASLLLRVDTLRKVIKEMEDDKKQGPDINYDLMNPENDWK